MKLPTITLPHDEITEDEFTARWIYHTMKLPTMKKPKINLPHDEITVNEITYNEISPAYSSPFRVGKNLRMIEIYQ